ncbi:sterol desaturase family protein [Neogemmobacter tilapiae]|uniref:Sterol desaturase n=1 Tax=Neogemmobacter tilapiae TaxID=875041 RepID=A0A918TK17_9RHOB|nr:sterol desaturase family protein [Gemmobacter tilapiae]GHC48452.1 sterol desaturase [Gemmobacter tilapiae]
MVRQIRQKLRAELQSPRAERQFGTGWIAGTLGLASAIAGLALVISLKFPGQLSTPELQAVLLMGWFRFVIIGLLVLAFGLATLSLALRPNRVLGLTTVAVALTASLIGVVFPETSGFANGGVFFGLDFFILNLVFLGFIFIPLERLFPHRPDQTVFRTEWREDLFYYLVSSMMVQVLSYMTLAPSGLIRSTTDLSSVQSFLGSQPLWLQIIEIMILTDFVQYWLHRAFHRIPALWRFHAVHHSAETMDWIAGARMHFFEVIILRAVTATPMFVLGFSEAALHAYILIVYVYSSVLHSNLRGEPSWLGRFLATPRFHHWHHGIEREAIDVNFSIHFPLLDRLFGTYHLPQDKWPSGYGIKGNPVPKGYWSQFLYPLRRDKRR